MNKQERIEKYINSPLYKLAETKLLKERKFINIGREKFVDPILVVLKMAEILKQAHKKGQKELLDNFIEGEYRC